MICLDPRLQPSLLLHYSFNPELARQKQERQRLGLIRCIASVLPTPTPSEVSGSGGEQAERRRLVNRVVNR